MRLFALGTLAMVLLVGGCSSPVEQVRQPDERPALLIEGAPSGAILIVDGLVAGSVFGSNGQPQAIRVEPGTHEIQVLAGGRALLAQRIYVTGNAIKTFAISGAGAIQ